MHLVFFVYARLCICLYDISRKFVTLLHKLHAKMLPVLRIDKTMSLIKFTEQLCRDQNQGARLRKGGLTKRGVTNS